MNKHARLLRAAGLIIILRDELEEADKHHKWLEVTNRYLDKLTDYKDGSNDEYEQVYKYISDCINTIGSPGELINELVYVLEKDMRMSIMTTNIAKELHNETLAIKQGADIGKVKLLDSKIKIF